MTSRWRRSMKLMIFIVPPHLGQSNGSTSYTCWIRAAQRRRASCAPGPLTSVERAAAD